MTEAGDKERLFALVARDDAQGLGKALEAGGDARARDRFGVSLLYHAAARGNLDLVETLLAKGAEVDKSSDAGNAPLMAAAVAGHSAVVKRLLAAGADPERRNKWGFGAWEWAKWGPDPEEVQGLLQSGAGG